LQLAGMPSARVRMKHSCVHGPVSLGMGAACAQGWAWNAATHSRCPPTTKRCCCHTSGTARSTTAASTPNAPLACLHGFNHDLDCPTARHPRPSQAQCTTECTATKVTGRSQFVVLCCRYDHMQRFMTPTVR
jgi:hypothetical protein